MIIDTHTHIFSPWLIDNRRRLLSSDITLSTMYSSDTQRMATAEELVSTMDGSGVDMSVIVGIGWNDLELCKISNDYIIESVNKFPDKLRGFISVNPQWGDQAVYEIERCVRHGLIGIGELHPDTQGFRLSDFNTMQPIVEIAKSLRIPILTHTSEPIGHLYPGKGQTTPEIVYSFVSAFQGVNLICAHWGGGLPFYALMPEISDMLSDVFFDTAASPFLYDKRVVSIVTELVGGARILMGTDYPLINQRRIINQITDSQISDEAKENILFANAARLFNL